MERTASSVSTDLSRCRQHTLGGAELQNALSRDKIDQTLIFFGNVSGPNRFPVRSIGKRVRRSCTRFGDLAEPGSYGFDIHRHCSLHLLIWIKEIGQVGMSPEFVIGAGRLCAAG